MTSQPPGALSPETPAQDIPDDASWLLLCDQLGIGVVRVSADGSAAPLNSTGETLLVTLGGSAGAAAPDPLPELLRAAEQNGPQIGEALTHSPESRHLAITAGGGLALLRDNTDERLLHERLLQSEKMASVGQLVSGVAHELNNPLTGVMGFSQLLLARDLDEGVRSQIQTIYDEAERAAKIVQNLLSFARRRRPTKEMADVNGLVQRVLELRSYDHGVRNITLDMTLDTRMQRCWVDQDQIQQVLFNVIKNAEQAMVDAHGGGKLTVLTQGGPEGVRVTIGDDGPGISPEIQRRIFDPFFTTKDAGQGTGLGLTICYGIIDEHGGRIWTENRTESGSLFHIELPVGVEEERESASGAGDLMAAASTAVSGRRVLVVDDEVSIRQLLSEILTLDNHSVAVASSGLEAADLAERESFDVIITDMKMPGMDGAAFYRQVRQRDPQQARRIIFITGDTVSPDTRAFLQRVSNPVLSKPFKIGPLRDAIETVLSA